MEQEFTEKNYSLYWVQRYLMEKKIKGWQNPMKVARDFDMMPKQYGVTKIGKGRDARYTITKAGLIKLLVDIEDGSR